MQGNKIQPSYDTNRQVLGRVYPLSTPFNVILDASETCNFKCNYCFRGQNLDGTYGYADNSLMEWDTFCLAAEQIKDFPEAVKQISFSNHGEPLCNRRLPQMVSYLRQDGIDSRTSIHTNFSLMDHEYALELAESGIDRIVISIQGLSDDKYLFTCGIKQNFEELVERIGFFYEHRKGTKVYIKIIDTALEDGEEERFYEIFGSISDRVYIEKQVPIWKDVELNQKESKSNKYGESFPIQQCCPLIFHTIVVTPKGDVFPCTQLLSPFKLGNIREQTIKEIWDSQERRELLRRQCELDNPEICKDCYILQNSIYTEEDMIDGYRLEILDRLKD